MIEITDYWPVAGAVVSVLLVLWVTRYHYLQVGRLQGRAEVFREQRHAEVVRL